MCRGTGEFLGGTLPRSVSQQHTAMVAETPPCALPQLTRAAAKLPRSSL